MVGNSSIFFGNLAAKGERSGKRRQEPISFDQFGNRLDQKSAVARGGLET